MSKFQNYQNHLDLYSAQISAILNNTKNLCPVKYFVHNHFGTSNVLLHTPRPYQRRCEQHRYYYNNPTYRLHSHYTDL